MILIAIIVFYLVGVVLAYGRGRAEVENARTIRLALLSLGLSWFMFFLFCYFRKGPLLQFRNPAKFQAKRELAAKRYKARKTKRIATQEPIWDFTDGKDRAEIWRTK